MAAIEHTAAIDVQNAEGGRTQFLPDGRRSRRKVHCSRRHDDEQQTASADAAERTKKRRMLMTSALFDWTPRCSTRGGAAAIPSDSYAGELPVADSDEDNQALSFKPAQAAANADDDRKGTTHGRARFHRGQTTRVRRTGSGTN